MHAFMSTIGAYSIRFFRAIVPIDRVACVRSLPSSESPVRSVENCRRSFVQVRCPIGRFHRTRVKRHSAWISGTSGTVHDDVDCR